MFNRDEFKRNSVLLQIRRENMYDESHLFMKLFHNFSARNSVEISGEFIEEINLISAYL